MKQSETPDLAVLARSVSVTRTGSSAAVEGEVPYEVLATYRAPALAALGMNVSLDGFRKGHVPEDVLIKHIGEMPLLSEMAERVLSSLYPLILREHELDAIGRPQLSITKLAPENPLSFTATIDLMPEIVLPAYKEIAASIAREEGEVTDEDLSSSIAEIQRSKRAYERMQEKAVAKKQAEDAGQTLPTPESVRDTDSSEQDEEPLPELTDEYVQTLGEFSSVTEFKEKLREHLSREKQKEVTAKHRAAITGALVEATTIDLPQVLIDSEIGAMFGQMEQDLTRANLKLEDYLSHIKKTREELAAEWKPAAEKRAKLQLILNEIAKKEQVEVDGAELEKEVAHILEHHKDADPERVRLYVRSAKENEAILKLLEEQSKEN